jgi:hypothetical protein
VSSGRGSSRVDIESVDLWLGWRWVHMGLGDKCMVLWINHPLGVSNFRWYRLA